jgi:hypothetical protein
MRARLANLGWPSPSVRPGLNVRQGQLRYGMDKDLGHVVTSVSGPGLRLPRRQLIDLRLHRLRRQDENKHNDQSEDPR